MICKLILAFTCFFASLPAHTAQECVVSNEVITLIATVTTTGLITCWKSTKKAHYLEELKEKNPENEKLEELWYKNHLISIFSVPVGALICLGTIVYSCMDTM